MMYRQTLTLERELDIPFAELKSNIGNAITCIPRVQSIENRPDGSAKIRLQPIQATPLMRVRACGWVQLAEEEDVIVWLPKQCPESNGCISGEARPAQGGAKTKIVATIDIFEPSLPALPALGRSIIGHYITGWADALLTEFVTAWTQSTSCSETSQ